MPYVLTFTEAAKAGPSRVGGKGWNTGRLALFGFIIPGGCVVSVDAYWDFLAQGGLLGEVENLGSLTADEAAGEAATARLAALRARIEAGRLPDGLVEEIAAVLALAGIPADAPLAVRSSATAEDSATASFAGIHRSFLNVSGPGMLADAIRGCYASLWTPTAVAYRRKMGLTDRQVGGALVIQRLVMSLYSGVAFSADPVTGRRDRVVVNASFGLGEAIVSGSVEADEYHLHIDHTGPVKLIGGRIGLKHQAVRLAIDGGTVTEELGYAERSEPVLAKPQLEELCRVVRRIQDTLGDGVQPQDVEWCHDGWNLVVTQARPVTALPEATFPALAGQATIWSNANLKDALPGVQSPLGWWFNSLTVEVLLRQIFWRSGYDLPEGLTWSRLHNGRAYMNLSALQWAAWDAFGWPPAETNRALGGHQPEIRVPRAAPVWTAQSRRRFARMTRVGALLRRSARKADRAFQKVWDWCREFERQGFSDRYHELEFLHRLWAVEKQRREFLPETMIHNVGGLWTTRLTQLLEKPFPGRGAALTSALLAGAEGITSAEQGYRLVSVARTAQSEETARAFFMAEPFAPGDFHTALRGTTTLKELERFLEEFGHRGVYEMEIMNPRWSEEPSFILETIHTYLRDGLPEHDPQEGARAKRAAAEAEVARKLRFSPLYWFLLGKARAAMRMREAAKSTLVRLVRPARLAALAIGRRLTAKGLLERPEEVFFLTGDEIASLLAAQWDGHGLRAIIAHRRTRRQELEALPAQDVILGDKAIVNLRPGAELSGTLTAPGRAQRDEKGTLQGVAVSSGQATGPARLIRHPGEGAALRKGEVLVAPSTDPAWTPLFLRAAAVVMEVGGYLSHGAIVAREYGIPAVVNVGSAMDTFRDGQLLQVDGDTGEVRRAP
ncbi:MAG TPA: PEP/pyruvate-binding domain-containing protein [Symbiobacteriaceae bacterium]|nr:PEP/pyruvate-binding domain-containing protein [Symbiobacteriaceae bacterium]